MSGMYLCACCSKYPANVVCFTRLIPVLAILFLCSFLDRTNVGNAKIIGLTQDLGMNDYEYSQGLAVYYATYIFRYL